MKYPYLILLLLPAAIAISSCKKETQKTSNDSVVVIKATGDIHADLDNFRHLPGDQAQYHNGCCWGRREINWDAVPDSMVGKSLPGDFFNPVAPGAPVQRQKGLVYAVGGEFRVSNANFAEVNSQAAPQFSAFSGNKTFANISSNLWEVGFDVAGQSRAATIQGFGVVFSDVDLSNSTSLEFLTSNEASANFCAGTWRNKQLFLPRRILQKWTGYPREGEPRRYFGWWAKRYFWQRRSRFNCARWFPL